jgi:hypothetical protein
MASPEGMPRSSRRGPGGASGPGNATSSTSEPGARPMGDPSFPRTAGSMPQGTPIRGSRPGTGTAATDSRTPDFRSPDSRSNTNISDADFSPMTPPNPGPQSGGPRPRDNSSRFDD